MRHHLLGQSRRMDCGRLPIDIHRDQRSNLSSHPKKLFAQVLREAAGAGVEIYAYNCNVNLESISIFNRVIVET